MLRPPSGSASAIRRLSGRSALWCSRWTAATTPWSTWITSTADKTAARKRAVVSAAGGNLNSYRPRGEQIFPLSALQIGILQKWHFTISEKVAIIKKLFRAVAQLGEQAIRGAGPPLLVSCIMQDLKLYISTIWGRSSAGRRSGSLIAPLFLRSNSVARKRFPSHKISYPGP